MPQQELHDADVDALGQKLGREAVTKCVRGEVVVETALCPCQVEGLAGSGTGQRSGAPAVGEEPRGIAVGLPDLAKHHQDRPSERQGPLLVAFADHPQEHVLGIDGGDGQLAGFAKPQATGVDQRETAAADRPADCGDQAAAVLVGPNVGKALGFGWADFFS